MMVDVDYLSRMHDNLVKKHTLLANAWSLVDRAAHPCAYKSATFDLLLSKGKYSSKSLSASEVHTYTCDADTGPSPKKQKVACTSSAPCRCNSPIQIHRGNTVTDKIQGWRLDQCDPILYCKEVQTYS